MLISEEEPDLKHRHLYVASGAFELLCQMLPTGGLVLSALWTLGELEANLITLV